jgi:hypothetical protein
MKKKYDSPKAEKVVFDYTESVVACSDWGWCKQNQGGNSGGNTGHTEIESKKGAKKNSDVSNPNWECKSPDYWGC